MIKRLSQIFLLLALPVNIHIYGQSEILLWEDNFTDDQINSRYWNVAIDNSGGGNNELQYYTARDTNVYIEDGKLIIRALKEEYIDRSYTSAKLTTRGLADFRYGRIESSIKLPAGKGIWPAFWMMPTESKYGGWPNSGEIDIMELIGQDSSTVYGTLHYGPPWNYTNGTYTLEEGYFSDGPHLFALEWTPDTMKWFVDNELYSIKTKGNLNRPEQWRVFQERFYLILNLAVGGNWPGNPDESTFFPQTMEVDFVKVYGNPANLEIIAKDSAYALARNVKYAFTDIPGATFKWSVTDGATIVGGQGTNAISVDWDCTPGEISLQVSNLACEDQYYTLPVQFAKLNISGREEFFPLSEVLFNVAELAETEYTWSYPDDVSEVTIKGDSIAMRWGCTEGYVKVSVANACGTEADSLAITLTEPRISGPSTVPENRMNVNYMTDPVPVSAFSWTVPSDALITGGQGTNSITVDFGTEAGNVSVEISNTCYTKVLDLAISITDTILLADYESSSPIFNVFSSTTFKIVPNPAPDEVNPSPNVAESFKSEVPWSGIYTDLGYNLDMTRHKKFHLKVLGPKTGNVLLKLEDVDIGSVKPIEVQAAYEQADNWQNLEFIFPGAPSGVFDRITIFFDFGSSVENTYYFDDLTLLTYESTVNPVTTGNRIFIAPNPAGELLYYTMEDDANRLICIYDIQGRKVLQQEANKRRGSVDLSTLSPGTYLFVAITNGKLLRSQFVKQ